MWIEYDTAHGKQYVNDETDENIQCYGNDKRYPEFLERIESGEIIPVPYEASPIAIENIKNIEQSWIKKELEDSNDDVLLMLETGVEPIGLKKYRSDLRKYYSDLENNIESSRPVLDPRTTLKKTWDVVAFK